MVGEVAACTDGVAANSNISTNPATPKRRMEADFCLISPWSTRVLELCRVKSHDRESSKISSNASRQCRRFTRSWTERSDDLGEHLGEADGGRVVEPDRLVRRQQPTGDGPVHDPDDDR